jgi:hypothetical protein
LTTWSIAAAGERGSLITEDLHVWDGRILHADAATGPPGG